MTDATTPEPTDPAGVSGVADTLSTASKRAIEQAAEAVHEGAKNYWPGSQAAKDAEAIQRRILALRTPAPAGVSGLADELERDTDWTFAEAGCWLALNRAAILAALRPSPVLEVAKEALTEARAALHQHYVDWDGEPEDAVPLQNARAKIDAALETIGAGQ